MNPIPSSSSDNSTSFYHIQPESIPKIQQPWIYSDEDGEFAFIKWINRTLGELGSRAAIPDEDLRSLYQPLLELIPTLQEKTLTFAELATLIQLIDRTPASFVKEQLQLAEYISSNYQLKPHFSSEKTDDKIWEGNLLKSMQWIRMGLDIATKYHPPLVDRFHTLASNVIVHFIEFEVIKDEKLMDEIKGASRLAYLNCWRSEHNVLDYLEGLNKYLNSNNDYNRVLGFLLRSILEVFNREVGNTRLGPFRKRIDQFEKPQFQSRSPYRITEHYPVQIQYYRQEFIELFSKKTIDIPMRHTQKALMNLFRKFFRDTFLADTFAILGPPPCKYDLLAMGSIGREEITTLADLECFILMEENEQESDNNNKNYFFKMGRLLEILIASIGERMSKSIPLLSSWKSLSPEGFHLDPTLATDDSQECNILVVTISEAKKTILRPRSNSTDYALGEFLKYKDKITVGNSYSLLKATSIISSNESQLFIDYRNAILSLLQTSLPSPQLQFNTNGQAIIYYTLVRRLQEFRKQSSPDFDRQFNLKNSLISPLTLLLTDLHIYFCEGKTNQEAIVNDVEENLHHNFTNTFDLIEDLSEVFSEETRLLLKWAVEGLYGIRVKMHNYYGPDFGLQKDLASFSPVLDNIYKLTLKEKDFVSGVYSIVLLSLYEHLEYAFETKNEIPFSNFMKQFSIGELLKNKLFGLLKTIQPLEENHELNSLIKCCQNCPIDFQYYVYQHISHSNTSEPLRELYITLLEKFNRREALQRLINIPNLSGYRQKDRLARRDLQLAIHSMTTNEKETPYSIEGPIFSTSRYLKKAIANQIFDSSGNLRSDYSNVSMNRVCHFNDNGIDLHFKQAPHQNNGSPFFPGKEQGVSRLMMRLFGHGCSFSELVYLRNTDDRSIKGYFVLISQTVRGQSLANILTDQATLSQIDAKRLSETFLSIPLILPGDHRPVNFVVEDTITESGEQIKQLVCIDNDVAWVWSVQASKILGLKKYTYNLYAPLFFIFPDFVLDTAAIDEFLSLKPSIILKEWFEELVHLNANYYDSFKSYLPTTVFPFFAIDQGMGGQIFVQFCYMQSYLRNNRHRHIYAHELFKTFISFSGGNTTEVGDLLYQKYEEIKKSPRTASEKMKQFTGRNTAKSLSLSQSKVAMFKNISCDPNLLRPEQSINELNFLSIEFSDITIYQGESQIFRVEKGFQHIQKGDGSADLVTQEAVLQSILALTCDKLVLSHCAALTDDYLLRLIEKSGEKLTYLDLRDCQMITEKSFLILPKKCPNLQHLLISGCSNLKALCGYTLNVTVSANFLSLQTLHVARCPNLTLIDLRSYALKELKADNNPLLTTVQLYNISIPKTNFSNCPLLNLNWKNKLEIEIDKNCKIWEFDKTKFTRLLENRGPESLNLWYAPLMFESRKILEEMLKINTTTRGVSLSGFFKYRTRLTQIFDALGELQEPPSFGDRSTLRSGVGCLSRVLAVNTTLTFLSIHGREISESEIKSLAKVLELNRSIKYIYLKSTGLGNNSALLLAKMLEVNQTLTSLSLKENVIGARGAAALGNALSINSTLQELNLSENKIGNQSIISLFEAIGENGTLKKLFLADNKIGPVGCTFIARYLATNTSLQEIDLKSSKFGKEGISALSTALKVNTTLLRLRWQHDANYRETELEIEHALTRNQNLSYQQASQIKSVEKVASFINSSNIDGSISSVTLGETGSDETPSGKILKEAKHCEWKDNRLEIMGEELEGQKFKKLMVLGGDELVWRIFSFLDKKTFFNVVPLVCKRWNVQHKIYIHRFSTKQFNMS